MSWGIRIQTTIEKVKLQVIDQLDSVLKYYDGHPEADDITAVKSRALALVDSLDLKENQEILVEANGSHSWGMLGQDRPTSATFNLSVKGV